MAIPIVPVAIITLCTVVVAKSAKKRDYGVMTPERKRIYGAAIGGSLRSAEKLRILAKAFRQQGLFPQAEMLDKRAALKERSPEVYAAHDSAFRRGLKSTNRAAISDLAHEFARMGATGAAAQLILYAQGLPDEEGQQEQPEPQEQPQEQPDTTPDTMPERQENSPDVTEDEPPPIRVSGNISIESTAPIAQPNNSIQMANGQDTTAMLPESTGGMAADVIITEGTTVQ